MIMKPLTTPCGRWAVPTIRLYPSRFDALKYTASIAYWWRLTGNKITYVLCHTQQSENFQYHILQFYTTIYLHLNFSILCN